MNLDQGTTKRGLVWIGFGVVSIIGYFKGLDPSLIMPVAAIVAGHMGVVDKE